MQHFPFATGVLSLLVPALLLGSATTAPAQGERRPLLEQGYRDGGDRQRRDDFTEVSPSIKVIAQGRLRTDVAAIGGETTGTTLTARDITLELDFQGDRQLQQRADRLSGQMVTVQGRLSKRQTVERGTRFIVQVDQLRDARPGDGQRDRPFDGRRPSYDDRPRYDQPWSDDRPRYEDRPRYGDRPGYGRPPWAGEPRGRRSYDDRQQDRNRDLRDLLPDEGELRDLLPEREDVRDFFDGDRRR